LKQKTPLEASWASVNGAKAYEVTVETEAKGNVPKKTVLRMKTENTSLSFKNIPPGDYVWTIRTLSEDSLLGTPMPLRKLSVTYGELLAPPQVTSPEVQ
jgi:hypothetical protein